MIDSLADGRAFCEEPALYPREVLRSTGDLRAAGKVTDGFALARELQCTLAPRVLSFWTNCEYTIFQELSLYLNVSWEADVWHSDGGSTCGAQAQTSSLN